VWHWFSGRAGTNNDLTVAAASPLFNDIIEGHWNPSFSYRIGEKERRVPYFLVDGIYPKWTVFATPHHSPSNAMKRAYTQCQESVRKDVERCFGVRQGRFFCLRIENKLWSANAVMEEGRACVVLHNMIVEMCRDGNLIDEMDLFGYCMTVDQVLQESFDDTSETAAMSLPTTSETAIDHAHDAASETEWTRRDAYCSRAGFEILRDLLVKNLWSRRGRTS
jgi:Plant transposon protein